MQRPPPRNVGESRCCRRATLDVTACDVVSQSLKRRMTTTAREHGCERCRQRHRDTLEMIGEPVQHDFGKAYETEQHFRCRSCGTEWSLLEEFGLGGHGGPFWNPRER